MIWQEDRTRVTWRRHAEAFAQPPTLRLPNDDDDDGKLLGRYHGKEYIKRHGNTKIPQYDIDLV